MTRMLWAVSIIVGVVIAALLVSFVFIGLHINKLSPKDLLETETVEISSGDEFVKELIKNSNMGSKYGAKKSYELVGDSPIRLTSKNIEEIEKEGNIAFYGRLDGRNRSIVFDDDAELHMPLFAHIGAGASIEQLSIHNAHLMGRIDEPIAVLAEANYGTIQDVSVDASIQIRSAAEASAIAVFNYGSINHCVAKVQVGIETKYLTNDAGVSKDWVFKFGAIAAINGATENFSGKIENVIVDVNFPQDFVVLSRQLHKNLNVGYVVGTWANPDQITNAAVLKAQFSLTAHDCADLISVDGISKTIKNIESGDMTAGNHPGWTKWQFSEEGDRLPTLIPNLYD